MGVSIMSSDSQAMGRPAEVITELASSSQNEKQRGKLPEDAEGNDNFRQKRYVSKYNQQLLHKIISHVVGSVEVGKFVDLVVWFSILSA